MDRPRLCRCCSRCSVSVRSRSRVVCAARVDVLTSNKVDVTLANFTVTDERKEKVDFAKPYMDVAAA